MKVADIAVKLGAGFFLLMALSATAEQPPAKIDPQKIKQLEAAGYEVNPEVFAKLATAGQPRAWPDGDVCLC